LIFDYQRGGEDQTAKSQESYLKVNRSHELLNNERSAYITKTASIRSDKLEGTEVGRAFEVNFHTEARLPSLWT